MRRARTQPPHQHERCSKSRGFSHMECKHGGRSVADVTANWDERSRRSTTLAHRLLASAKASQRLLTLTTESDGGTARLTIEDAPPLERLDARLLLAVAGGMAGPRHLDPAARADAQGGLLHEAREPVGHAAEGSDAGPAAQGAGRRELARHGAPNELALVGHRVEQRREVGLDLERHDVLAGLRLPGHDGAASRV